MWFSSGFGVYSSYRDECRHWVEIKSSENLGLNGYRYCGNKAPEGLIRSVRSSALITFRASSNARTNARRGFQLFYSAEYDPDMPYDNPTTVPESSTPFHWQCNFETMDGISTLCGMTQSMDDEFDWSLMEGPTPSRKTGPREAKSEPYYAFIEASHPRRKDNMAS